MAKTGDLTEKQFKAALERNGFELLDMPLYPYASHKDLPNHSFPLVCDFKNGRILRRESLASLIKGRDRELRKRQG